jgi:GNAT superfamily N-acetyltransferase
VAKASPAPAIRLARPADVPAVLRLIRGLAEYERMLPEVTATEGQIHEALFVSPPRAYALIAEIGGTAIGLALYYYTLNTFKLRPNIFLEDLFVDPAHRGTGAGYALMRDLARRAVAENCGRIEWRVLNWNQPSIDFYHRIGSRPISDWHTLQLGGGALAALAEGNPHG